MGSCDIGSNNLITNNLMTTLHNVTIPYPCNMVVCSKKTIVVYDFLTKIGKAVVSHTKKGIVAKSDLKEPIELLARGRFVMRDGDIINEFHIIALEVKRDVVETTER